MLRENNAGHENITGITHDYCGGTRFFIFVFFFIVSYNQTQSIYHPRYNRNRRINEPYEEKKIDRLDLEGKVLVKLSAIIRYGSVI